MTHDHKWSPVGTIAMIAILAAGTAGATDYHVSPSGSDSADGRSLATAWRTLGKANRQLRPGDTALIHGGVYAEAIQPDRSGSGPDSPIKYRAKGKATIKGGLQLDDRRFIVIDGIDIAADRYYARLHRAAHIVVENSTMTGAVTNPAIYLRDTSYSRFVNNTIVGTFDKYMDLIKIDGNSHHNLFDGNTLAKASHALVLIVGNSRFGDKEPRYNIFRRNEYTNEFHHCVNVQYGPHHNVFEHELFMQCGLGSDASPVTIGTYEIDPAGEAWHAWQPWGIYRFNVVTRSGSSGYTADHVASFGGISTRQSSGRIQRTYANRIYHNTFVDNYGLVFRLGARCPDGDCAGVLYGNNHFKNNILYNKKDGKFGSVIIKYDYYRYSPEKADVWRGNLIGTSPDANVLLYRGQHHAAEDALELDDGMLFFADNRSGAPQLSNDGLTAFSLARGSPAIDAGVPLTYTVAAGSGRTLTVEDARYFIDGFGIVEGDVIQVGDQTARVVSVAYGPNTLTVGTDLSWPARAPISMPYSGAAPDIGAREHGPRPKPPGLGRVPP